MVVVVLGMLLELLNYEYNLSNIILFDTWYDLEMTQSCQFTYVYMLLICM